MMSVIPRRASSTSTSSPMHSTCRDRSNVHSFDVEKSLDHGHSSWMIFDFDSYIRSNILPCLLILCENWFARKYSNVFPDLNILAIGTVTRLTLTLTSRHYYHYYYFFFPGKTSSWICAPYSLHCDGRSETICFDWCHANEIRNLHEIIVRIHVMNEGAKMKQFQMDELRKQQQMSHDGELLTRSDPG